MSEVKTFGRNISHTGRRMPGAIGSETRKTTDASDSSGAIVSSLIDLLLP